MKMPHGAAQSETIERYVRNELPDADRRVFEEHLLECEECFEAVRHTERFVAGIRHAAAHGHLDPAPARTPWLIPAFAGLFILLLAVTAVSFRSLQRSLEETRRQRDVLAQALRAANAKPIPELRAANLPLVILEANRAQTEQSLTLDPSAHEFALWVEAPANHTYTLEVSDPADHPIQRLQHLKPNPYHALAATLPADKLPPGHYVDVVRLFDENPRRLLGQYLLRIIAE